MTEQDKLDLQLAVNEIEKAALEFIDRLHNPNNLGGALDKKLGQLQRKLFFAITEAKLTINEMDAIND